MKTTKKLSIIEKIGLLTIIGYFIYYCFNMFQIYSAKQEINEIVMFLENSKLFIAKHKLNTDAWPKSTEELNKIYPLSQTNLYIQKLIPSNDGNYFIIKAIFNDKVNYTLKDANISIATPSHGNGTNWICSSFETIPDQALPYECKQHLGF